MLKAQIAYNNGSRIGKWSISGESRRRGVVACWNWFSRTLWGGWSNAPGALGLLVDGSPVPSGSTATYDSTVA
ncbi:hypothetical protein IMZ38_01565 [Thermosphaera chiliense]|uniref:Uncharacterized protein n=1 Tax=Thermosphaera chiliense TaxID=3402707 RepID=A0A7M1URQ8_9CREN|nr:hypothetical protein [Thermosphaera aggregans]QOR94649.1 hypothetical protein IMZ38_01565 [Thermosphaera aggregans]